MALLETRDGGQHWEDVSERLDNEDQFHLNAIAAVKDNGLLVVGEAGSLLRSKDWGATWEKLEGPYEGSLFGAIGTADAGGVLVYGLRGHLFRSADFGDSWEEIPLKAASATWNSVSPTARCWRTGGSSVGHGGSVLESTDGGRSFSVFNRPDGCPLAGVSATGGGPPDPGRPGRRAPRCGERCRARTTTIRRGRMSAMNQHQQNKASLLERLIFNNRRW